MKFRILVSILTVFSLPLMGLTQSVGGAETETKKATTDAKAGKTADSKGKASDAKTTDAKAADAKTPEGKVTDGKAAEGKAGEAKEAAVETVKEPVRESKCLASEEIIRDLEAREKVLKEKETSIAEREKDIEAQKTALKEELTKLETTRAEIQGIRGKDLAEHEEKINKLIEAFESMSPKSAAAVISKVDEELAVTALSRLTTTKAGKILAVMDPVKSSHLSELIAFGNPKASKGKEKDSGESTQRAPASSR